MNARVIGLTGGIASGKSTVARMLADCGAVVIDADQLAREVVEPGSPLLERIKTEFGDDVIMPDGTLDRKRMGELVFSDSAARKRLEAILHPEIRRCSEERIAQAVADGGRIVVYMAPLLIEAGATDRVDEVWVVKVSPDVQLKRLMERDGISRSEAQRIIDSQMPSAEKERFGRVLIDNNGTTEETSRQVLELWKVEIGHNHE